uniref:DUF4371 domain-containing protein n=1 Tax=Ascaris lumbricoides TaxID=6252 RepID=A0A0M3HWT4_ASCLU
MTVLEKELDKMDSSANFVQHRKASLNAKKTLSRFIGEVTSHFQAASSLHCTIEENNYAQLNEYKQLTRVAVECVDESHFMLTRNASATMSI